MRIRSLVAPMALFLLACGGGSADQKSAAPKKEGAAPAPAKVEVKVTSKSVTSAPAGVTVDGKVVAGATFTDSTGDNVLLLTEVARHPGKNEDEQSAELYGYQFVNAGGAWKQVWKIQDFVKDCPVDITCSHLTDSVRISDIDQDGLAETLFAYRLACRGDVSPPDQKVLMHEGETKYALRGTAGQSAPGVKVKGKYEPDPAFDKAPAGFLDAAISTWMRFGEEKLD